MPADILVPTHRKQLRHGLSDWLEDFKLYRAGILDLRSLRAGYRPMHNPVEVVVRDKNGKLKAVRRQHNQQLNVGINQLQRIAVFGDVGSDLNGMLVTGSATAPTATTFTSATALPTAAAGSGNTGLQGHILFVANSLASAAFSGGVFGVIVSNTASVITVDQWYAIPVTGAVGTTPAADSAGIVLPGGSFGAWIALSTDTTTPAATDVFYTSGLWSNGTTTDATITEQTASGLARAFCGYGSSTSPSFPAAQEYQFQHTWTYTGSTSVTIAKVILANSAGVAGSIPLLDTLLSATATLSASGDTVQVTWTVTL